MATIVLLLSITSISRRIQETKTIMSRFSRVQKNFQIADLMSPATVSLHLKRSLLSLYLIHHSLFSQAQILFFSYGILQNLPVMFQTETNMFRLVTWELSSDFYEGRTFPLTSATKMRHVRNGRPLLPGSFGWGVMSTCSTMSLK